MRILTELIGAADPALGAHAVDAPPDVPARVPDAVRAFVLEAVREGYLLHYDDPRAFRGMDADLRLLAGDSLYALGLARLAAAGDLAAVTELADLISACAQAESEGRRDGVAALWEGTANRLAQGRAEGSNR